MNPKYNMRGSAWKNDNRTSEGSPHWKGSMQIGGADYWLSVWYNPPEGNKPELTMSLQAKENQAPQPAHPQIGAAPQQFAAPAQAAPAPEYAAPAPAPAPQRAPQPSPYANVPNAADFEAPF